MSPKCTNGKNAHMWLNYVDQVLQILCDKGFRFFRYKQSSIKNLNSSPHVYQPGNAKYLCLYNYTCVYIHHGYIFIMYAQMTYYNACYEVTKKVLWLDCQQSKQCESESKNFIINSFAVL